MNDTPRTDKAEKHAYEFKDEYTPVCESKLVRQLERELNAASKERDDALMMLGMYRMKSDEQKQRIKRLEEAIQERDKEWFQVIESILGFHPVSMTEALRIGIERIKKQKQRIKRLDEENNELRAEEARLLNTKGELERRIKRMEEMYEGVIGEKPELLGSNVMGLLKRELNFAQNRIKRLEEAGDEMFKWSERVGQEFWLKAKEAKL